MVTISGMAQKRDGVNSYPAPDVTIEAYSTADPSTPVVTGTSDASANFAIAIPTGGTPVDGYLKATLPGYLDTYEYPPHALAADLRVSLQVPTTNTTDLLSGTFCGSVQDYANGIVALTVTDADGMPVAGATISSDPAPLKYCYNLNGYPNKTATQTDVDGIAYLINVPAGKVTMNGNKSGTTFRTHVINARANTMTLTQVSP
jgi:hypothetical protein